MADITPKFVSDYIDTLGNLQTSNPDQLGTILGVDNPSNIDFTPSFNTAIGSWVVSSTDLTTGQVVKTEVIQSSTARTPIIGHISGVGDEPPTGSITGGLPVDRTPILGTIKDQPTASIDNGGPVTPSSGGAIASSGYVTSSQGFTDPVVPPSDSITATVIDEMFSYSPSSDGRTFIYNIGIPSTIQPITYTLRNNCISNPLRVDFTKPSFVKINMPPSIQIQPLSQINVTIAFDESVARNYSISNVSTFSELFQWTVTPLNITGPIYIQTSLPAVTSTDIPLVQETISVNTIDDSNIFFTNLYASFDFIKTVLKSGEHGTVQLEIWAGDNIVSPKSDGSVLLQFGSNSITWSTSDITVLDIDNFNGSGIITFMGLIPGTVSLTATINQPPLNMTLDKWNTILNNSINGPGQFINGSLVITGTVEIDG